MQWLNTVVEYSGVIENLRCNAQKVGRGARIAVRGCPGSKALLLGHRRWWSESTRYSTRLKEDWRSG